ncbi:hydrogenase maturation protease [Rubrivirga sp.]|uniref:hydrogenase maturation protease n=1 Tax=Rubrivirga sp. TaxID=1885344 RepID=UPI003C77DBBA
MTATDTSTVTLRDDGYLLVPRALAEERFPSGAVFVTLRDGQMWLLPTSGAGAGGFLLKRRNAAGDRAVLVLEAVPSGTAPGDRTARWDDDACALRITLGPD